MSNTGTLTDKGLSDRGVMIARIDDRPFDVLPHVLPFLDKIEKGSVVDFFTKDGKISKIQKAKKSAEKTPEQMAAEREEHNNKTKAAGFQTAAQVKQEQANTQSSCTSPEKSATANPSNSTGLKTAEGQIVEIDHAAHKITVKDRTGALHSMIWGPQLNDQMQKLKQWWFTKITGEHYEDADVWKLTNNEFFKRPEDWPFKPAGGKCEFGQPRNDKAIILQTCLKVSADLFMHTHPEGVASDFREGMPMIVQEAITAAEALCKAGGV